MSTVNTTTDMINQPPSSARVVERALASQVFDQALAEVVYDSFARQKLAFAFRLHPASDS
ncbi:hypothetical protein [Nocardia colli]|uniref:hypothetical protein n=1 Tax=Nocardia colli TaxID=2545717 RepID=UPI0035DBF531